MAAFATCVLHHSAQCLTLCYSTAALLSHPEMNSVSTASKPLHYRASTDINSFTLNVKVSKEQASSIARTQNGGKYNLNVVRLKNMLIHRYTKSYAHNVNEIGNVLQVSLMEQMAYKNKRKLGDQKLINHTRLAVFCKLQLEKKMLTKAVSVLSMT